MIVSDQSKMLKNKIFGLGLNKTGTSTLGECCRRLGFRHVSYRSDMLTAYLARDIDLIIRESLKFDSFEDWPWPLLYKELYDFYQNNALYILTTRADATAWLDSLKRHSLNTDPERPMRTAIYGYKYPHGHEAEHLAYYENHNASVREFFRERKAPFVELCWENGDGWKELCAALGTTPPDDRFPHVRPRQTGAHPTIRKRNEENILQKLKSMGLAP